MPNGSGAGCMAGRPQGLRRGIRTPSSTDAIRQKPFAGVDRFQAFWSVRKLSSGSQEEDSPDRYHMLCVGLIPRFRRDPPLPGVRCPASCVRSIPMKDARGRSRPRRMTKRPLRSPPRGTDHAIGLSPLTSGSLRRAPFSLRVGVRKNAGR
jgi:hypothetical protein